MSRNISGKFKKNFTYISHLGFNLYGERFSGEMNNINIIFDELRQNETDIDKQTLSFHIKAILDNHKSNSRQFWWRRFNLPCRKRRRQTSDIAE